MKKVIKNFVKKIVSIYRKIIAIFYRELALMNCDHYLTKPKINGFTKLTNFTHLGNQTSFNGMIISGRGTVKIGDYFHSGKGCEIMTQNHNYNGKKIPYDETYIIKDVTIQNFVWLGNRVTILPGVTIGEGAIIQAGSVVTKDIPDNSLAVGVPAKIIKNLEPLNLKDE